MTGTFLRNLNFTTVSGFGLRKSFFTSSLLLLAFPPFLKTRLKAIQQKYLHHCIATKNQGLITSTLLRKAEICFCTVFGTKAAIQFYKQNYTLLYKCKELEVLLNFCAICLTVNASKININLLA